MSSLPPPGPPHAGRTPPAPTWGETPPLQWVAPDDQSTFIDAPAIPPAPKRAWLGGDPLGGQQPGAAGVDGRVRQQRARFLMVSVLLVGAGVTLIASSFATWVHADLLGVGIRDGSGWSNVAGHLSFGPGVAAAGIAVVFLSLAAMLDQRSRGALWFVLVALIAAAALAVVQVIDLNRAVEGVQSSVGVGIWMMVVAVSVGLALWPIAFVLARHARRPSVSPSSSSVVVPAMVAVG